MVILMFSKLGVYAGDFFLCLLVAPAGVLKIAHRQMKNKQGLVRGGEKVLVVAGGFIIIFFILITAPPTDGSTLLSNPFTYLYACAGILALVIGILMIFRGLKYNKYRAAIENHNLLKVADIAKMIGLPEQIVIKDLLQMIVEGFFPELRFDAETKTLKLNDSAMAKLQSKAVRCESCGASVTVFEGKQNRCEYCNSALNY